MSFEKYEFFVAIDMNGCERREKTQNTQNPSTDRTKLKKKLPWKWLAE